MRRVVIVGAGPAGMAAAVQLARYGIMSTVVEAGQPGGLLLNASLVENYPGFPEGISGPDLVGLFVRQFRNHGLKEVKASVTHVGLEQDRFAVSTCSGRYLSEYVIVASGTSPVRLECAEEGSVHYHVWDLREVRGARIAVVGAGDAAFDYALNLAARGNQVVIHCRSGEARCLPLLWERARATEAITFKADVKVTAVHRTRGGMMLETTDGRERFDHVLAAIGRVPERAFLSEEAARHPNLYMAGDVKNMRYRQTAIAVGDGLRCAMEIAGRCGL